MKASESQSIRRPADNETGAVLHGGARPGAGRKASKNPAKSGSIRLTPERWDKLRALGMEWLSGQIDAATLPESGRK
ncbi:MULTISPECIES: hypothetical protein [Chromobacterium]|uniref:hypothetical protein n=1 Tax=Chromobacterium TaxID=535 RepID=UPI0018876277|nr:MULTISPECIES: hypothetical protein [Chromobacterium]WON84418.1 hypothetical protein OK026_02540 [Chromobacterium haemolyticum]